jgi:hypothetical protein
VTPSRLAATIILAAFGPYLTFGLRTEQVAIYLITALIGLGLVGSGQKLHPGIIGLMGIWTAIFVVSVISGLFPPFGSSVGSPLSGVDALLAPLCLMFVLAAWAGSGQITDVLLMVQKWTVALLALNAVLALTMSFVDLAPVLSANWWTGSDGPSVGELAARNGRYGGIFNSPLAAGTAYGAGMIALVHLYVSQTWTRLKVGIAMVALLVGGLMPQSKAFMLAGLPIAVLLLVVGSRHRRIAIALSFAVVVTVAYVGLSQTLWWTEFGRNWISTLLAGSEDPLFLYTAGRYSDDNGWVGEIQDTVLENAPWGGYGTGVNLGALDTSWVEMLARAGLIGLAAFGLWLLTVVLMWAKRRQLVPRVQWWTAGAMIAMTVAAATGGPSLTQNRAGTLILMNLLPLLVANEVRRSRPGARGPVRSGQRAAAAEIGQ